MTDRADRMDRPALRGELDGKTSSEKSADKDFTIGLDLPLRHSSSVTSASVDSIVEDRPDRHVTPEVYLKWAHQYDWLKASAEVGASVDRYFKSGDANMDALHSSFKLAKTDGKWEYFVPYASISNEMFFLPTFKQADITYNDIAAGFYSGIAWRDKTLIPYVDAFIPYSDASEPGDVSIYFDARFGRRMSDSTNYQNTFASGKVTASYIISDSWRVEANASIRARWYGDYHGEKRTDVRPSASLGVTWTPDWLKKSSSAASFRSIWNIIATTRISSTRIIRFGNWVRRCRCARNSRARSVKLNQPQTPFVPAEAGTQVLQRTGFPLTRE